MASANRVSGSIAHSLSNSRLFRDLNEWRRKKSEFPCIEAIPLESDIREWHCNIAPNDGALVGLIIHIIIKFPKDYPIKPPSIHLCNSIPHPNVNGNNICLDMLRSNSGHYSGWTSAYSIVSILMQLQSFLFEERGFVESNYSFTDKNYYFSRESLKKLNQSVKKFHCKECGHCFDKPNPVPPSLEIMKNQYDYFGGGVKGVVVGLNNDRKKKNKLTKMCENILDVFDNDSVCDHKTVMKALIEFEKIVQNFGTFNDKERLYLKKYIIGQATSRLMHRRYDMDKSDLPAKIGSVCNQLLIFAATVFATPKKSCKKTTKESKATDINDVTKMNDVDENVGTSIVLSILNSESNFYRQCLHSDYISLIKSNRLHISKWRRDLKVGSKLDCMDFLHDWYTCKVLKLNVKSNQVYIRYDDWGSKWDEWVTRDNPRLQPFRSVANGGAHAKRVRRRVEGVAKANFSKYELDNENDSNNMNENDDCQFDLLTGKNKNNKNKNSKQKGNKKASNKFAVFRGLLTANISFRLVEALNVFGENDGFKLLLARLKEMNQLRNVRCVAVAMEKSFRTFTPAFRDEFVPLLHNCLSDILCNLENDTLKCLDSDTLDDIINSMKMMALPIGRIREFYHTGGDKLKQDVILKHIQSQNNFDFAFWDGMYQDLENSVLKFLNVRDLQILSRVAKRFQSLVNNSRIIQRDSIKCWFYHSANHFDGHRLCLGLGITPKFFGGNSNFQTRLRDQFEQFLQIFPQKYESYFKKLITTIGDYPLLQSIDTTFDLLSMEAFEKHKIRSTVFNNCKFTHFMPLWIENKHGELCMKQLPEYTNRIFSDCNIGNGSYHPFLSLYSVGMTMLSLIVSVMHTADTASKASNNAISLHYSTNVLETFFRYHHLLLAIYCRYKNELAPIIQPLMKLFFCLNNSAIKNKKFLPNLGVFFMFLPLWEQKQPENERKEQDGFEDQDDDDNEVKKLEWQDIVLTLLDETLIRQVKWVIKEFPRMCDPSSKTDRIKYTWQASEVSRKMFLFEVFFIKHCAPTVYGSNYVSLREQLDNYNRNYGFPDNNNMLSLKLQQFVKKIYKTDAKRADYAKFFELIEAEYPGNDEFASCLEECLQQSADRKYHRVSRYNYDCNYNKRSNKNKGAGGYNDLNSLSSNTDSYASGTIYEGTRPSDTPVLKPSRPVRPPLIQRKYLADALVNGNVNSGVHTVNDRIGIANGGTMDAIKNINISNVNANMTPNGNINMQQVQIQQYQTRFSNGMNLVNVPNKNYVTVNCSDGSKRQYNQYQPLQLLKWNNFNNYNNNNMNNSLSNTGSHTSGSICAATTTTPSDTPVLMLLIPVQPPLIERKYLVDTLTNNNVNSSVDTVNDGASIMMNNVSQMSQTTRVQVKNNVNDISPTVNIGAIGSIATQEQQEDVPARVHARTRRRGVRKSIKKKMAQTANAPSVSVTTTNPKRQRRRKKKNSNQEPENGVSVKTSKMSDSGAGGTKTRRRRRRKGKGNTNEENKQK